MEKFLSENWQGLVAVIGSAIAWINRVPLSRLVLKKEEANIKSTEVSTDSTTITNLEKGVNLYIAIVDDLSKRLSEKEEEISRLREEIIELRELVKNC